MVRFMPITKFRGGKDTFWELLNEIDNSVKRIAIADELKIITDETLNLCLKTMEEYGMIIDKELFATMMEDKAAKRSFLIEWGTGVMRERNSDIWLDTTLSVNKKLLNSGNYVITDIRFENEYDMMFNRYNVIPVLINVKIPILKERYFKTSSNPSEEEFYKIYNSPTEALYEKLKDSDKSCFEIDNNGDFKDYKDQISLLLNQLT